MTTPLRVLIVEDRDDDTELVLLELRRGGFDPVFRRVETAEAMSAALEQAWDIVISDWSMPRFSAMAAFATLKEKNLDLPFIIVSGTIGEEIAVSAMKVGVHDFMSKGRLSRLIPAIERELREVETRRQSRKMREQLLISERMASVGTLAAGVAHEINNPLGTLIGNVEFALAALARLAGEARIQNDPAAGEDRDGRPAPEGRDLPNRMAGPLAEARESLEMIQEAAERVRLVVRDLRVFSHPGEESVQGPVDIRAVLESSIRMASTEIRHRANLVRDYGDVPPVEGSEARLGQVFLNLIVNAAQAIPEGRASFNEVRITVRTDDAGRVTVEIRDTGTGIPEDVLLRIFDPFFTTKPSGTGTGLGLAICHRLVTALGGEITVESVVDKGTAFLVSLPAARAPAEQAARVEPAASLPQRHARILVVDDEARLRKTIERMLEHQHSVTAVASATEALELIVAGTRFDIILCDLMMPEMTGMDLHSELNRLVPDQASKMAFVTGGAFTDGARRFLERIPNAAIEKPFRPVEIQEFVQKLLQG